MRLEDEADRKQYFPVQMGATGEGKKELIAVEDGYRESEQSWLELLVRLKQRGIAATPKIGSIRRFLWVRDLSSGSKKGAAPPSFPVASALGNGARPMRR